MTVTSSSRSAIVFDLDGTLVDVSARDYAVYRDLLDQDDLVPLPFEEYWPLRRERTDLASLLARSTEDARAYMTEFVRRRGGLYESPSYLDLDRVLPTVMETLAVIREHFDVVLITAREDALATEQQLRARGIRPYLDAVYVANNNKAAALRRVKSATLVVGDTEHDIELAAQFGYPCFAVTTGIRSREFLAEAHPAYLADSLSDVLAVL